MIKINTWFATLLDEDKLNFIALNMMSNPSYVESRTQMLFFFYKLELIRLS